MNPTDNPMPDNPEFARLDAYLDGLLTGAELVEFEAELSRDPGLRRQVELSRLIDHSLRAAFEPEAVALGSASVGPASTRPGPAIAPWRRSALYRISMLAAAAALLLAAGVFTYTQLTDSGAFTLKVIRPDALYARVVDAGFTPEWVCTNDAEFAESVSYRLGQPLLVAAGVPGLEVLGWAYPHTYKATPLSERAMILLSTVDGQRVVVFMDRAGADKPLTVKSSRLHLFKRRVGDLVLYEVTPMERPVVIEAMYKPDTVPDQIKAPEPG